MSVAEIAQSGHFGMNYEITQMMEADLKAVVELEESTGLSRWGYEAYRMELFGNPMAIMRVARSLYSVGSNHFVLGFVAMIALNSIVTAPAELKAPIATITAFLLSMALAAMGLETDIRKLRAKGIRPLILGAGAWIFIGTFSLGLIKWIV